MAMRALVLLMMLWLAGCGSRPLAVSPRALAPHARDLTIAGTAAAKVSGEATSVRGDADTVIDVAVPDGTGHLERRATQATLALHFVDDAGRIKSLKGRDAGWLRMVHSAVSIRRL